MQQTTAGTKTQTFHQKSKSEKAVAIPEIWKWCGDEPSTIRNPEILFENYPLLPGTDFSVIIRGESLEPRDNVIVKTKITIGGFFSIMDVQNMCKGPGKHCPYDPGLQEQRLKFSIPRAMFGSITTQSILYAEGAPIACIKMGPLHLQSLKLRSKPVCQGCANNKPNNETEKNEQNKETEITSAEEAV